jgi:hypothetical protein
LKNTAYDCWGEKLARISKNRSNRLKEWDTNPEGRWKQIQRCLKKATKKPIPKKSQAQKIQPIRLTIYHDITVNIRKAKRQKLTAITLSKDMSKVKADPNVNLPN